MRRIRELVAGPAFARRLTLTHALDDFAIAFINMSLLGSLFFSVSATASRNRVLAYLLLTVLPLALCAPFLGRILDRTTVGARALIIGSQLTRAAAAIAMIPLRFSVALYPLAFVVLVSKKVYSLTKSALLTQLTHDGNDLVRADAHLARTGSIIGSIGTAIGGALAAAKMQSLLLTLAVPLFIVAAWAASGLRPLLHRSSMGTELEADTNVSVPEVVSSSMLVATWGVSALRAAAGALTYLLALAVKRGGNDQWIYAAGLLAAGVGAMTATFVSAPMLRRLQPDTAIAAMILLPALITAVGVSALGQVAVLLIAGAVGLANSVAGRSIVLLQSRVPLVTRGRVIARTELRFQIANVVGAAAAVQLTPNPRQGIATTGLLLAAAGIAYVINRRVVLAHQAQRFLVGGSISRAEQGTVPEALLAAAKRTASLGGMRSAMLIAYQAVEVAHRRTPLDGQPGWAAWQQYASQVDEIERTDGSPDDATAMATLAAAETLLLGLDAARGPHVVALAE